MKVPSLIAMESLASKLSKAVVTLYVPPVIFRSSLQETPLPFFEVSVREPVPFNTRSSFEKITASVLVSPSDWKVPVTERELEPERVRKHLSAETT